MALSRDKKQEIIAELVELLSSSKMTVIANYEGVTVKEIQALRLSAEENGTVLKVVKNRLVKKAVEQVDALKEVDTSDLSNMLMYAFNSNDEVAAAQVLKQFAKSTGKMEFIGAFSSEGEYVSADDVRALADLPGKDLMIATLINTLNSPLQGVMSGLGGDLHGILRALEAKAS